MFHLHPNNIFFNKMISNRSLTHYKNNNSNSNSTNNNDTVIAFKEGNVN